MPTMHFLALFFSVVSLSQASTVNKSNSGHGGRRAIKDDRTPDTAFIDPSKIFVKQGPHTSVRLCPFGVRRFGARRVSGEVPSDPTFSPTPASAWQVLPRPAGRLRRIASTVPQNVAEFNVHGELSRAVRQSDPCYRGEDAAEVLLGYETFIYTFDQAIFKATIRRKNVSDCRIINAEVYARFLFADSADAEYSYLPLLDRGQGVDQVPFDGVYTGQFTKFRGPGRYQLCVSSNGSPRTIMTSDPIPQPYHLWSWQIEGTGVMGELAHRRKARPRHVGPALRQHVFSGRPTGNFNLDLDIHAFRVEADLYEDDVPPGKIKDLRATPKTKLSADGRPTVTFQWTCGGNHGYDGTAAALELRGANNTDELDIDFQDAPLVDAKYDVVNGSLTPQPALTEQEVEVAVPYALLKEAITAGKNLIELHFSICTKSSTNIYSMLSNFVTVTVKIPSDIKLPTSTNPPLTSTTSKKEETKLTVKETPSPPPATTTRRGTTSTREKEDRDDEKGKDGGGKGSDDTTKKEEDSSDSMTYAVLFAILAAFGLMLCLGMALCMSTQEEQTAVP